MRGFKAVGLQNNYEIIKESADRLSGNPSKDGNKRQEQLDKYCPDFNDLDDKFYDSGKDIETALNNLLPRGGPGGRHLFCILRERGNYNTDKL